MKAYIITIIGATLLSAVCGILSPEKWRGFIQVITGLVIISCIVSPITNIVKSDVLVSFENIGEISPENENMQTDLVVEKLRERVNDDIEARMEKEFNIIVSADCEIRVNGEGEIEGVDGVHISGNKLTERAKNRICEVYGLNTNEVYDG